MPIKNCLFIVLLIVSCQSVVKPSKQVLYDQDIATDTNHLNGFKAVEVFQEVADRSVWVSPERQCVQYLITDSTAYAGQRSMQLKWNKITGGCQWIGLGFGWNNWMAKDFSDIYTTASIQMAVKSCSGTFKNLPVAFAFEDYAGTQNYYGFQASMAPNGFSDSAWTIIKIPLLKFNLGDGKFELENVKQFMIQLEAEGGIYLDDIRIVKN